MGAPPDVILIVFDCFSKHRVFSGSDQRRLAWSQVAKQLPYRAHDEFAVWQYSVDSISPPGRLHFTNGTMLPAELTAHRTAHVLCLVRTAGEHHQFAAAMRLRSS